MISPHPCPSEGRVSFEGMIRHFPKRAQQEYRHAVKLLEALEVTKALRILIRIVTRHPKCWPAWARIAVLAQHAGDAVEATSILHRLTKACPDYAEGWVNLGITRRGVGDYTEAEPCFRKTIALRHDLPMAWFGLGDCQMALGDPEEARATFLSGLHLKPQTSEDVFWRSHYLIAMGEWKAGWTNYEARWLVPGFVRNNQVTVDPTVREWRGAPLVGKTLLVVAEQGAGDTLMCLRYAPVLDTMAKEVIWAVNPLLVPLLQRMGIRAVSGTSEVPPTDYAITAMSLHWVMQVTPTTVPSCTPLRNAFVGSSAQNDRPSSADVLLLSPSRNAISGPRLGLCWQGNRRHRNDATRSVPLSVMQQVIPDGWGVVSVCKGEDSPYPDVTGDWITTAEALRSLEHLITVDTGVAHLAGLLDVPTTLLVSAVPDMRWMYDREDTPWYHSVRLVRQKKAGGWNEVIDRVRNNLTPLQVAA